MVLLVDGPGERLAPVPAVFPDLVRRLHHQRLSRRRCSTGGSLPAFTCSASIGASLNCFGVLAASVITCGRLPLAAGAVVVVVVVVAAAAAGCGVSAAFWAAAGGAAVGTLVGGAGRPQAAASAAT